MTDDPIIKAKHIIDQFLEWQETDGSVGKEKCPYFAPEYEPFFRYAEVPLMARAMFRFFSISRDFRYRDAAALYCRFYLRYVENLVTSEKFAYKFGLALESASLCAKNKPEYYEAMKTHISLILMWLRQLRTEHGSCFLCGYKMNAPGEIDVAFSDDLLAVGRGLLRTYETFGGEDVLRDLESLAHYYVTDIKEGTMDGVWNPSLGTWAIGAWPDTGFEHIDQTPANQAGWGFSAYGAADFLLDACYYFTDEKLKEAIFSHSKQSLNWILNECQFDDGHVGMTARDDKWIGMTGAAVMLAAKLFKMGLFSNEEAERVRVPVQKAWDALLKDTGDNLPVAGFIQVTGLTHPRPGDNVGWLLAWAAEALMDNSTVKLFARG